MSETSLEQLVQERHFAGILQTHGEAFFRLCNSLLRSGDETWNKKHFFQLISESNALESFLDDHGARFNQTYAFLTELVASLRWFAHAGYSLSHLLGRIDSYGIATTLSAKDLEAARAGIDEGLGFLRQTVRDIVGVVLREANDLGLELRPDTLPEDAFMPMVARRKLPRNVGQAELVAEEQKIAEVASKYLSACNMLAEIGIHRIEDPRQRHQRFSRACTEEQARVYESTVHNLQSTYDTHVQNTVLEARDPRLMNLRGHVSAALHLLETVTYLAHFLERHEDDIRSEEVKRRISSLVDRNRVQDVVWNQFLFWANAILQAGGHLAEGLLPSYTNVQDLVVRVPDELNLHARPVALIVGIVQHHGTPVEMVLGSQRCNASSILELLVCIGSQRSPRELTFRGDERPLRDIRLLFEHGLGENGSDALPPELDYLRVR